MYGTDHNVVLANKMTRSGNEDHRGSGKVILPLETKHPCGSSRRHAYSFSKRIRSGNENILVAAVEVILSFGKQDDQRRLAAMLPAAIGGHAASGDLAVMPSAAIGGHYPDTPDSIHYFRSS